MVADGGDEAGGATGRLSDGVVDVVDVVAARKENEDVKVSR